MVSAPVKIDAAQFISLAGKLPVIDVRSPGEFQHGHIPGALNIPLFDNNERAKVGTVYAISGQDEAIVLGKGIADKKKAQYLENLQHLDTENGFLLHCWRGGLRSSKIAGLYSEKGYKVFLLEGGYKAYRKYIRQQFSLPRHLIVLGGYTGTGKTQILKELKHCGEQIIDLEALACHKGSHFGHLGNGLQPTTEQFENELFTEWNCLQPDKRIWIEHESLTIGSIYLPDTFYNALLRGKAIFLQSDLERRIDRIVAEYGNFSLPHLDESLQRLSVHMGRQRAAFARQALQRGDLREVASITLAYYDTVYDYQLKTRPVAKTFYLSVSGTDTSLQAREVLRFVNDNISFAL